MNADTFYADFCKVMGLDNVRSFSLNGAVGKQPVLHVSFYVDGEKKSKLIQLMEHFKDVSEQSSTKEKT